MKKTLPRGTYGVVLTPFDEQGKIDELALKKELEYCLATKTQGLLICGSTSEFVYMSLDQCKQIYRMAHELIGDNKTLIGGASSTTEERVLNLLNCLSELGYDYAIVCPPYYYPQKEDEIFSFYQTIAEKAPSNINIILYNIPFCAPQIPLSILAKLMSLKNIIGMKDSSGDMLYLSKVMYTANSERPEFSIYCGQDAALLPSLTIGTQGIMSSLALILDRIIFDIINCFDSGNLERAEFLQLNILSIIQHLDKITFPENYKALAEVAGIPCGLPQRAFPNLKNPEVDNWKEGASRIISRLRKI